MRSLLRRGRFGKRRKKAVAAEPPGDLDYAANPTALVEGNQIENTMRLKLTNRTDHAEQYVVSVIEPEMVTIINGESILVDPGQSLTTPVHFKAPESAFKFGRLQLTVEVTDSSNASRTMNVKLMGPTMSVPSIPDSADETTTNGSAEAVETAGPGNPTSNNAAVDTATENTPDKDE